MYRFLTLLLLLFLGSCSQQKTTEPEYTLVWSDEFEQEENKVNTAKWFQETVAPNNGSWYNNERQHYTDREDNAQVSEGSLKIIAKKEDYCYFGVEHGKTVVVSAGNRDVFHPCSFDHTDPFFGIKIYWIKEAGELFVFIDTDVLIVHHPFSIPQNTVASPMDKKSKTRILKPGSRF